jgi:tetratricopeptide (TPR) repeat protein
MRRFRWPNNYTRKETISEKMLYDIIAATVKERPVYMICTGGGDYGHPIIKRLKKDFELLPEGVTYRVWPKFEAAKIDLVALAKYNEKLWSLYRMPRISDGSIKGGELEREIPGRYAAFRVALGDLELRSELYTAAEINYRKSLDIDDKYGRARSGLAVTLSCQGRYYEAAREWRTVLERSPSDKLAQRGLQAAKTALANRRVERTP